MKKLLLILTFLPTMVFAQTQSEAVEFIKSSIEKIRYKFPATDGPLTLKDIRFENNNIVNEIILDESYMDLDTYAKFMTELKSSIISVMSAYDEQWPDYFFKSNLNIKNIITGSKSSQTRTIFVSAEEIKESYKNRQSALEILETMVAQSKSTLPKSLGQGLSLIDVYLSDGYLVYCYQSDNSIIQIETVKAYKQYGTMMEETMIAQLNNPASTAEQLVTYYIQNSEVGLKHVYSFVGSNETFTFTLTPGDIKSRVAKITL